MTFLSFVFALLIPFVVQPFSQALPITQGFFVSEADAVTSVTALRVKNAGGTVVPASYRVLSRWGGLPTDASKPIKVVLVDFTPNGAGDYTLDESGDAVPSFTGVSVADNGSSYAVATGTATIVVPKTGTNLLQSFLLGATEQLRATKPQLSAALPARSRLVQLAGQTGVVAAPAGSTRIRVNLPGAWSVGQQLRFAWEATFVRYGEGIPKALVYEGNYGYDGNFTAYSGRRFIFDQGNRNIILTAYNSIFDGGIKYFDRKEPRGSDGIPDGLEGVSIKDYDAFLEPTRTIVAIQGDELVLDAPLVRPQMVNCEVLPVGAATVPTARFDATAAFMVENNAHRVVIKQVGALKLGSASPYPDLTVAVWWYFYAGQSYARARLDLLNRTGDINRRPQEAIWSDLKLTFPVTPSPTVSSDSVLVNAGPGSASARVLAGQTVSTAAASSFEFSVPEFPQRFPISLAGAGEQFEFAPFPNIGTPHAFPRDRRAVWEFFVGQNASLGAANVGRVQAIQQAAYIARSKAVRFEMLPKRTWVSADFDNPATDQVDAANRMERMIACSYAIEQCDSQASLGSQVRMDSFVWRTSDHTQSGLNQRGRHFGWDAFGQFQDSGDGFTNNRYDEPFIHLFEFLRSGDGRAYQLGAEGARYMGTLGMCWSAFARNGNTVANLEGLSWYEKAGAPFSQLLEPKATHSWDEGVWLYYALTGDPIVYESAIKRRDAARRWNYNGIGYGAGTIGTGFDYNEARGNGWAALNAGVAYRFGGDPVDAAIEKQYLDNLADSEIAQGSRGVYVANLEGRNYSLPTSTGTQPFIWAGYPFPAVREYIMRKRFERAPDVKIESYAIRVAKWILAGDATGVTTSTKPLRGGQAESALYRPMGGVYSWYPNVATNDSQIETANAVMLLNTLSLGAWLSGDPAMKATAIRLARDLSFYRDFPAGALDPAQRSPITMRNTMFNGSARKLVFQTAQGSYGYLWDELGARVVVSDRVPVIATLGTVTPSVVVKGSPNIVLLITGTNFLSSTVVQWNGQPLATDYNSPVQIFASVPASLLTQIASVNITAVNPDGTSAIKAFKITAPSALAPRIQYGWVTRSASGVMSLIVSGDNFGSGAQILVNGYPISGVTGTFVLSGTLPEAFAGYQIAIQVRASDGTLSNQVSVRAPTSGQLARPVRRVTAR